MNTSSLIESDLSLGLSEREVVPTVGYVSPGWPPSAFASGIVSYVATSAKALRRRGGRSAILTGKMGVDVDAIEDEDVIDLNQAIARRGLSDRLVDTLSYRFAPGWFSSRRAQRVLVPAIRQAFHERGLQIVEMEESFGVSRAVARQVPVPVVLRLHGPRFLIGPLNGIPDNAEFRRRVRAEGRAIAAAIAVTSPSQDVLERTRNHYKLPLESAEVIPNPAPPCAEDDLWDPNNAKPNLVLFIGRFDRIKGGDVMIDAFDRVLRRVPGARLQFVGPDRRVVDDEGRTWCVTDYIRMRSPEGAAAESIEYLGQQPHGALAALRRKAAAVVVCSRYENFPTTVLEAASQGCPIVASHVGGIPEIIEDEVNGLLCRPGDPGDLAESLIRILEDQGLAERLGRQARIDCERRYHPDVIADRMVDFYRRVLARWESGRRMSIS